MVDVFNQVFNLVATALRDNFDGIQVEGEYNNAPAKFPLATVEEKSNTVYTRTQDNGDCENHATLFYELNFYSNLTTGKVAQVRSMFACADAVMASLGFTRVLGEPIPNTANMNIARYTARYKCVIDVRTQTIYRR